MIRRFSHTRTVKEITVVGSPLINIEPQGCRNQMNVHIKRADVHRVRGKLVKQSFPKRVPHRERPGGDERHAGRGGWIKKSKGCYVVANRHLNVVHPITRR